LAGSVEGPLERRHGCIESTVWPQMSAMGHKLTCLTSLDRHSG
jgi:hypothetical protein